MNWFIVFFFIIAILFFLITKYYQLKKTLLIEQVETFENENSLTSSDKLLKYHNIKLKYINSKEASNLIIKDSDYLKGMNQANLSARGCVSIDDLYNKYINAFDDITKEEKITIDDFILNLITDIEQSNTANININNESYYNYVKKWLNTINIAKAKPWLESGMPHTLDTTIVMDANWFIKPRKETLLHEITHIHQRQYPIDFEDLYPLLGYYYNPVDIKGLESIYPLNRNNPDGMDKYWLWHNSNNTSQNQQSKPIYWWIGAIFNTAIPNSLGDVNLMALKLDKDEDGIFYYLKQTPTRLSNLKDFVSFFGENQNNYHPNEMTAKFAEWYLVETLKNNNIDNEYGNHEGYKIYKKYYENMIQKYYSN
jgi:hypothetical protein